MRKRRALLSVGLAAGILCGTTACDIQVAGDGLSVELATGRAQDTWTRSYAVAPGGRLELINVNGQISAEPASGSSVELVGERTARAATDDGARELLDKVEMREEAGESRVRVEVRAPRTFGVSSVEVRWSVKVPRGVVADIRNVNGRIALTGLEGEVHARTVNGGVEGRGLAVASLEASTTNGGVDVELTTPLTDEGTVSLESVNGGVVLALHEASRASVTARVTNGGVSVTGLEFQLTGEQTRRRFEGTLNGGGARVSLETTNGGVRISKSSS
jgi:hypothetical protein